MTKNSGELVLVTAGMVAGSVTASAQETEQQHEVLRRPDTRSFAFASTFQGEDALRTGEWVLSEGEKYAGQESRVRVERSNLEGTIFTGDYGLLLDESHKHYAVGATLDKPYDNKGKDLVMQYEVQMRNGAGCGGAYVKMLRGTLGEDITALTNDSPYSIMFGPDKCFRETNKVHFIFQHQNPLTGEWEEKHLKKAPKIKDDKGFHLYTLHIKADNTFEIYIDTESVSTGSLLEDFEPSVHPPQEIDDPEDMQPEDWVTAKKIADPDAKKPEDWDEDAPRKIVDEEAEMPEGWLEDAEEFIPDPESKKPEDWDDEEDGDWEPVMVPNPACQEAPGCGEWTKPMINNPNFYGPWQPPMIDNPEYQGPWIPRKIQNPQFFEDPHPSNMAPITGLAVEIWTVDGGVWMDNFVVGDDIGEALKLGEHTWRPKFKIHEAKAAEEKKILDEKKAAKKNKKDKKSDSYMVKTAKAMVGRVRPLLPASAGPGLDAVEENPAVCLGTLLVGFVLLLVFAPRKRKSSASSRRAPNPPSELPREPSPEDEAADDGSGAANAGVSESKKSEIKKAEGEGDSATEKDDGDASEPAAPPAEAVAPDTSTS